MSSSQAHQGNLPSLNDIISQTKEVEPNNIVISGEKPQVQIQYSNNMSSQRGNMNQSSNIQSTINETNGPSSVQITRTKITSQPVTETHVIKTKIVTTTTRGGLPTNTKTTTYNNTASSNIPSVNKTKTTTTTTTNNYTRPKITSTMTYNKVGTNNINPNINNRGAVYNKNQVAGNYKNQPQRVQNSHSYSGNNNKPQRQVIPQTKYIPKAGNSVNIRRKTINRGSPVENIQITHIIYSVRPLEFHITDPLNTDNLNKPVIQITEEERNNLQKTGKVEARFSPNCDSMKEPEPVNLKGKLTHYQHAQRIGMTDDKNPYINPKFYFSEIKTLDPLPLDKGEVNTQILTFRSDGKNLNQTKTQTKTQPKIQPKPVSNTNTVRTGNNYSQGRSYTNYTQTKSNIGSSNRGIVNTAKTTASSSSNYRGNPGTGSNGQIMKETTTKIQMGSRSQFNNQTKPISTTSTERKIYNQNIAYKK